MNPQGRATGKAHGGRLRVGEIISHQGNRGSIPSKFETVLNTGPRERDGFLRRTNRFDDPETDLPGPGAYQHSKTTLLKDKDGAFTSKRGTGGFASTQKRFFEEPRALFITPGPGNYTEEKVRPRPAVKGASFAKPHTTTRRIPRDRDVPGPGEYALVETQAVGKLKPNAGASSVFKSATGRDGFQKDAARDTSKSDYTDAIMKHKSIAAAAAPTQPHTNPDSLALVVGNSVKGSAVFQSGTDRDGKKIIPNGSLDPKNLPPCPGTTTASDMATITATIHGKKKPIGGQLDRVEKNLLVEGIHGNLGQPTSNTALSGGKTSKPSAVFAPTTLDRFGRSTVKYTQQLEETPGPGYYNAVATANGNNKPTKKLLISSSWAMSGVGRFTDPGSEKWKPPGPAFYRSDATALNDVGNKHHFHLNSKGLWV